MPSYISDNDEYTEHDSENEENEEKMAKEIIERTYIRLEEYCEHENIIPTAKREFLDELMETIIFQMPYNLL